MILPKFSVIELLACRFHMIKALFCYPLFFWPSKYFCPLKREQFVLTFEPWAWYVLKNLFEKSLPWVKLRTFDEVLIKVQVWGYQDTNHLSWQWAIKKKSKKKAKEKKKWERKNSKRKRKSSLQGKVGKKKRELFLKDEFINVSLNSMNFANQKNQFPS